MRLRLIPYTLLLIKSIILKKQFLKFCLIKKLLLEYKTELNFGLKIKKPPKKLIQAK